MIKYKKEFILADILYSFTEIIHVKKSIKILTKYTYEQTKHNKLLNYFELNLLKKIFKKLKINKDYQKKNKIRLNNSFVKRKRRTDDTPLLIF